MSAPTVTDTGFNIEEHATDDGLHIRAVDTMGASICGALQHSNSDGTDLWGVLVYGGRDPDVMPLSLIPDRLAMVRTKEAALQWVRCIATLYSKAVVG